MYCYLKTYVGSMGMSGSQSIPLICMSFLMVLVCGKGELCNLLNSPLISLNRPDGQDQMSWDYGRVETGSLEKPNVVIR